MTKRSQRAIARRKSAAPMVTNKDAAETLILKEASKLRTTVSLLRHLAARRSVTHEEPKKQEDTE